MYLPLLEQPVRVESPGAVTGHLVRMTVTPQGVENVQPETAVVSVVKPKPDLWIRDAFCNDVHFFSSPETAETWLTQHPEATIIPVEEAFILGQQLLQQCG
jgi:alkylmercury lyase